MAEVTVGELAKSVGAPVDRLLKQMHEAGLQYKSADEIVSDDEKQRLLSFLKSSHGEAVLEPKKVTLPRKTTTTIKSPKVNARKVHAVEIRKKRIYIKREDEKVESLSSGVDGEIRDENILNTIRLGMVELTSPLISGAPFTGTAKDYDDGDAIISVFGLNVPVEIKNGKFSSIWPHIKDGGSYPVLGVAHEITLSQSDKVSRLMRDIEPPAGFAAIFLENPVIDEATYPTANFTVTPTSGDQVLYVESECTIFADGAVSCKEPITTRVFHRVEKTGICYEYSVTIQERFVEKISPQFSGQSRQIVDFYEATNRSHSEAPATEDKLNRQNLVDALTVNLIHKTNNHHRTIGLLGEWGSGKSTVLNLLKKQLYEFKKQQPFIFGEFNAWSYEHTNNIQAGVAQEFIKAITSIPERNTFEKKPKESKSVYVLRWLRHIFHALVVAPAHQVILQVWVSLWYAIRAQPLKILKASIILLFALLPVLLTRLNINLNGFSLFNALAGNSESLLEGALFQLVWFGGFLFYFGKEMLAILSNPLAKELLTYIRLPDYAKHLGDIPVMRNNIKMLSDIRLGLLCGRRKRLLFVIDDLDRCSSKSIIKVLEAIRLVLELEGVVVVIAIDQHIALAALSEHFKDFASHHPLQNSHAIAREYLSKIINLPIVLTKSNGEEIEGFMRSLWKDDPVPSETKKPASNNEINNNSSNTTDTVNTSLPTKSEEKNATENEGVNQEPMVQPNSGVVYPSGQPVITRYHARTINALSDEQKNTFVHWVTYFELSNSRQIKRLGNSYDLMRAYKPNWDSTEVEFYLDESKPEKVFPMQLTLILMEYLNDLKNIKARKQLWNELFICNDQELVSSLQNEERIINGKIDEHFINAYRNLCNSHQHPALVANVEAFVLPAMNAL